jgi:hypothetical protein
MHCFKQYVPAVQAPGNICGDICIPPGKPPYMEDRTMARVLKPFVNMRPKSAANFKVQ